MAEASFEIPHPVEEDNPRAVKELEPTACDGVSSGAGHGKRESTEEKGGEGMNKKQMVEIEESVEEKAFLGPKVFGSSVEMLDYFHKLLHSWSPYLDVNEYEHMVLLDLLKKGHPTPQEKIGDGIQAFQVRHHPLWRTKCFRLLRFDGSRENLSIRKYVDRILPLPESMQVPSASRGNTDIEKSCGPQKNHSTGDGEKKPRDAQERSGRGWRRRGSRGGSANEHGI